MYCLQKSCLLVFWPSCSVAACSHVRMYGCMYVRMYVCMYVCKYIRTYSRIFLCRNIFWILHSLCWTEPIHRHRRRHVTAAISQSFSVFLFCHSWLLQSAVCFQPQLGTCVCFDSARTVHVQCTATVHGLETLQIPWKNAPRHQNKEKTGFRIFFCDFMQFLQMTCYLQHFLRVHCGVHCGVHCACTVRALSKHTHSACVYACIHVCMYVRT